MEFPFIKPTKEQCKAYLVETVAMVRAQGLHAEVHKDIHAVVLCGGGVKYALNKHDALEFLMQAENIYMFYDGAVLMEDCYTYLISAFLDQFII